MPTDLLTCPCSSKYTWWNFLPLFLFNAFSRLANAYFLVVCVMQSIPAISITNGTPTSLLPLGIVLVFDGTATAREDYKRHVDDAAANNSKSACPFGGAQSTPRAPGALTHTTSSPPPPLPPPSPRGAQRWWCAVASL